MTENGITSLEPSEKQKKILAAKKKLKSFQAKRAAVTPSSASGDTHADDDAAAAAAPGDSASVNSDADANANTNAILVAEEPHAGGNDEQAAHSKEEDTGDLAKELEQLKLQINAQREQLMEENKRTRAELQSNQDQLSVLEAEAAAKEKDLNAQLTERESELQSLKDTMRRVEEDAAMALQDASELHKQQLAERESQLTSEHSAEAAKLTAKIQQRDGEIVELNKAATEANAAHSSELARQVEEARIAADAAAADAEQNRQKIADLNSQLSATGQRADVGEARCAALEQQKRELESSIQKLEGNVAAKDAELEESHAKLEQAGLAHTENIFAMRKQAEEAEAEYQADVTALNEKCAVIQRAKDEQEAKVASLEADLASQAAVNNEKAQRVDELEADLAHVGQIRDTIQAKHDKLAAKQKESLKTIDRLDRKNKETSKALESMESLKNDIDAQAKAEREMYTAEKAALELAAAGLQARIRELEAQMESIKSELEHEQSICAEIRNEKQQLDAEISRLTDDAEAAETEHLTKAAELGRQLDEEKAARQSVDAAYTQAQATILQLEEKNAKLEEDLQIEAEAAKEAFEELSQEHSDLDQRHSQLSAMHKRLTEKHLKAIASTQAWISELQEASTRHKEELGSLEEQGAELDDSDR
ncbi:hypothetical protein BX070DRAFT_235662 [Coemansia spiralis]|nr:hypothetical protein BX070DRAFT_235662 [Coemansia spiralis]